MRTQVGLREYGLRDHLRESSIRSEGPRNRVIDTLIALQNAVEPDPTVVVGGFDTAVKVALAGDTQAIAEILEVLRVRHILDQRVHEAVLFSVVLLMRQCDGRTIRTACQVIAWQILKIHFSPE